MLIESGKNFIIRAIEGAACSFPTKQFHTGDELLPPHFPIYDRIPFNEVLNKGNLNETPPKIKLNLQISAKP